MDDLVHRLAAAEAAVAELRSQLADLRAALVDSRGRARVTMRDQLRCPGCDGRRILHATQVLDRTASGRGALAVTHDDGLIVERSLGTFAVFICAGCGLVEWYVRDADQLRPDGKTLCLLDGGVDPISPYR